MEENSMENKSNINSNQTGQRQLASAIIIAGIIIGGAILVKGNSTPVTGKPISKIIGLNVKSFNACLASGKYKEKIQADIDNGNLSGVNGTPSSFIVKNGKIVDIIAGAEPLVNVMEKIASALEEENNPTSKISEASANIRPISEEDHILGNINAKLIIVEYSDLECPFCKVFHATMHQAVEKSGGEVAWVYRHYPIPQLHPKAFHEAEATECAFEQKGNEGFWKYTDKIFEITPSNNGLLDSQL